MWQSLEFIQFLLNFHVNQRWILFFKKILPAQTELGDAYVTEAADSTSDTLYTCDAHRMNER